MLTIFATLAAVALAAVPQNRNQDQGVRDTTVAVQQGARLDVNNFGGEIVVRTWNQNNVRVRASHSSRSRVDVSSSASTVLVKSTGRRGPSIVDLDITVPGWMGMTLAGHYTDITVDGAGGPVTAESNQGDISITGGTGSVVVKAIEGDVTLARARGRIQVNAVEGDVRISDATGDLMIETIDGDVILQRVDAATVEINTVDGDIVYDGTIREGGSYRIGTHDGDITVAIPPNASVRGTVVTFEGEVDSSFPLELQRAGRRRFNFTIGTGRARLELETFDGDIRLRRPGEVNVRSSNRNHDKDKDHDYDFDH